MPDGVDSNRATHNEDLWEQHARWWQDTFTRGADVEYEDLILPLVSRHLKGARHVLDIGCGEGQVARCITELGAEVVGLDPSTTQVEEARRRAAGPRYARARAEALPCRSGAFDAVLVCLAFEHVDAIDVAMREVARVLEPGGRFVMLVGHPLLQAPRSGWVEDQATGEHYWRIGAYLADQAEIDEVAPGVRLRFLHRPVSRYVRAIVGAGLLIDDMEEPAPPPALIRTLWEFPEAATIPRVLLLRARRGRERRSPIVAPPDRGLPT